MYSKSMSSHFFKNLLMEVFLPFFQHHEDFDPLLLSFRPQSFKYVKKDSSDQVSSYY